MLNRKQTLRVEKMQGGQRFNNIYVGFGKLGELLLTENVKIMMRRISFNEKLKTN